MAIVFPDYRNSILNLTNSILKAYGIAPRHESLPALDTVLQRTHRNRVLLIIDGLGLAFVKRMMPPESFLRRHLLREITSVYPCTTTAATTTFQSGLSPIEHGWLGWNGYFKEYGRVIDLFLDRDSFNGEPIEPSAAKTLLPFTDITRQICQKSGDSVVCRRIMPPFDANGVHSMQQIVDQIRNYCQTGSNQLILAYWNEPDTMMHKEGPYSDKVVAEVMAYDRMLEDLINNTEQTLLIVTADHGQIAVERDVILNEIPALADCLIMPPSLEARAASLFVKPSRLRDFRDTFNGLLGNDFLLMPRDEVFDRGLFGPGQAHRKVDDFVGDFLACATGGALLRYQTSFNRPLTPFKGHHAGLRDEEMIVPLIVAES
jgi:hypothetical protein